jgi:hypothetical protein
MKKLRHITFIFVVVLGLAFSVSAQKGGDKGGRPPKNPPTVDPGVKNQRPPKGNPPKEKPGRPGMAFVLLLPRDQNLG